MLFCSNKCIVKKYFEVRRTVLDKILKVSHVQVTVASICSFTYIHNLIYLVYIYMVVLRFENNITVMTSKILQFYIPADS